ncbi:hypothetical protein [Tenacibaculum maritimum]|uniref:hypothetical protein n=1 Tax=Tenacibaculum maritimum TaxID=107401 RepID=UPI003876F569
MNSIKLNQRGYYKLERSRNSAYKAYIEMCTLENEAPSLEEINIIKECYDYKVLDNLAKKYQGIFMDTIQIKACDFLKSNSVPNTFKDTEGESIDTMGLLCDFFRYVQDKN